MTEAEILQKAIEKAFPNGVTGRIGAWVMAVFEMDLTEINKDGIIKAIIFSHDFAKAFWGEVEYTRAGNGEISGYRNIGWKRHLQQMVLEKNPIKYLEQFLNDNKK